MMKAARAIKTAGMTRYAIQRLFFLLSTETAARGAALTLLPPVGRVLVNRPSRESLRLAVGYSSSGKSPKLASLRAPQSQRITTPGLKRWLST